MKPLILLDVDGVLNPTGQPDHLEVAEHRGTLVRELAEIGDIVWATTWSAAHTFRLGEALGLPRSTPAIAFPTKIHADNLNHAPTPKLHWVSRWLARNAWDEPQSPPIPVVWIDDHLKADARERANGQHGRVLLIRPDAAIGLEAGHVEEARAFAGENLVAPPSVEQV